MMSTQMACDAPLMEADAAIAALLAQPQEVHFEERTPPRLRLVAADGSTTAWTGEATAQTRYGGEGETVFMEIASNRKSTRLTPVTNAHLVCRLLLEKKKQVNNRRY